MTGSGRIAGSGDQPRRRWLVPLPANVRLLSMLVTGLVAGLVAGALSALGSAG